MVAECAAAAPARSFALKLRGSETGNGVMMFESAGPPGGQSTLHLHHDSDEIAYILSGEVTFMIGGETSIRGPGDCAFMPRAVPHAWKFTGTEPARVLFLYTPAKAGGLIEEQQRTDRRFADMSETELADMLDRHGWKLLGPSPL